MTEKVFKVGLIALGVVFLVFYYFHSQNGRYQHIKNEDIGFSNVDYAILDTREGTIYMYSLSHQTWVALHPRRGMKKYYKETGPEIVAPAPALAPDKNIPPEAEKKPWERYAPEPK
jgi:hypothetical protein